MQAPPLSWGAELAAYEREKRHTVDRGLLQGQPNRLALGQVAAQDRFFDPLLQRFREPEVESHRRTDEDRERIAHLNRAQDIQIMREQPFNILTHESRLESLVPGEDPTRLGGSGKLGRRSKEFKPIVRCVPEKDYHIVSNLPLAEHHWARPEDRPPVQEQSTKSRKLHAHLVKDFNIVTNRYHEKHEEKERQAKRLNLLESTQKYMRQNRFDPVAQQFNDPRHEEMVRAADNAREAEIVMRAESQLPPTVKGRESAHYGIISHEVHNEDVMNMWDQMEEDRKDRYKNRYIVEHNVHVQDLKTDHITNSRRLNRVAPERFEESKRRGYDIIDNTAFGQGPKDKVLYEPFTRDRMTPWEKVMDGRAPVAAQPASSSMAPALTGTMKLAPEAGERQLTGSSSAQQLRATPSVRSGASFHTASTASSKRRSELRRSESVGATLGGPAHRPAPPGQTRPVPALAPPAPDIPGNPMGSVFSRPREP